MFFYIGANVEIRQNRKTSFIFIFSFLRTISSRVWCNFVTIFYWLFSLNVMFICRPNILPNILICFVDSLSSYCIIFTFPISKDLLLVVGKAVIYLIVFQDDFMVFKQVISNFEVKSLKTFSQLYKFSC